MIEVKISPEFSVKLYESGDEMPMDLYFLSNQYALLDAEAGSTIEDVLKKFERMDAFHRAGKWDELLQERRNLHNTFYNIIQGVHFPSLVFGCHIHSVNDKKVEDHSTDHLMAIMKDMARHGFTLQTLQKTIASVKKK